MSRVNIYIRKEDEAKWQAIANKPEWLHEHLDMPKATKDGYRSEHSYVFLETNGRKLTPKVIDELLNEQHPDTTTKGTDLADEGLKAGSSSSNPPSEPTITPPEDAA